jgi:acetylglutamate kinase
VQQFTKRLQSENLWPIHVTVANARALAAVVTNVNVGTLVAKVTTVTIKTIVTLLTNVFVNVYSSSFKVSLFFFISTKLGIC